MIGFIIHLAKPWFHVQHLTIVARDEFDMLKQAAELEPFKIPGNYEKSRVVKALCSDDDWLAYHQLDAKQLCSECRATTPGA